MKGFQAFGLRHKVGIGQNNEIHVSDPMKILIVNLSNSLGRTIGGTIECDEFVPRITKHLEAEHRSIKLAFHSDRIDGVVHIPHPYL